MRALSLQQPHANRVTSGEKTIETRTWKTPYRGDILICSSLQGDGEPKGVALSVVELVDIRPMTEADETAACVKMYRRANAWLLDNRRVLATPFPVKGKLGLFTIEVDEALLEFI